MKKNKGKVNDQLEKKEDKEQYYLKLLLCKKLSDKKDNKICLEVS